jgi:hypothetical protein
MRVNITYSEELENIPGLVSEFMRSSGKALLVLSNHVGAIDDGTIRDVLKGEEILEVIENTRQKLAAIDERLADASSLLSGYNNAIQGKTNNDDGNQGEDST